MCRAEKTYLLPIHGCKFRNSNAMCELLGVCKLSVINFENVPSNYLYSCTKCLNMLTSLSTVRENVLSAVSSVCTPSPAKKQKLDEDESTKPIDKLCSDIEKMAYDMKSCLFHIKTVQKLSSKDIFTTIVNEIKTSVPLLFNILNSTILGKNKDATMATIYGMILQSRNNRASAIQKLNSCILIRYHADNEVIINFFLGMHFFSV